MTGPLPFPYDDPAWDAVTDAYLKTDTRDLLQELTENWDDETADYLFFSSLLHQSTTYGATFLALPHVVALAKTLPPDHRRTAAVFLGGVALHGQLPATSGGVSLHPDEPWVTTPTGDRAARIFASLLPDIAALCISSYREDPNPWHASGVAACYGDLGLAGWLEGGEPGTPTCPHCRSDLEPRTSGNVVPLFGRDKAPDITPPPDDAPPPEVVRLRDHLGDLDPDTEALVASYRPGIACPVCDWSMP